jgi:hypothetical protein
MSGFGSDRLGAAAATTPSEEDDDAIAVGFVRCGWFEARGGCAGRYYVVARENEPTSRSETMYREKELEVSE